MSKSSLCLLVIFSLLLPLFSLSALEKPLRDSFSADLRISDLDNEYYRQAVQALDEGDWETALHLLQKITGFFEREQYIRIYLSALHLSGSAEAVIDYIDSLAEILKIRMYDILIEYYIFASLEIEDYDGIAGFIELQRRYYPNKIHNFYKKTLCSLLKTGNNEQAIELTDIFPNNIYLPGEKNFILGVIHYNMEYYRLAEAFMLNVLAAENSPFREAANDFLYLITYISADLNRIPDDLTGLSERSKLNLILLLLEQHLLDEAGRLILELESDFNRLLMNLFISWEAGHYKTALTLLRSLPEHGIEDTALLNLIAGETLYHTHLYRDAVPRYRKYLEFDNIDEKYANHALGYCFKGYYRFNSTAYWWIKNLEPEEGFYDSLAARNLAKLYTFTENYHTAKDYFDYFDRKYGFPAEDKEYLLSFLKTMEKTESIPVLISFFAEHEEIIPHRERVPVLRSIGDYYLRQGDEELAVLYYDKVLDYETDYQLILKLERLRFGMGEYKDSEDFVLSLLKKYPESRINTGLALDLAKYYLNQKRYRQAVDFIEDFLDSREQEDHLDSLAYYSALAHKELMEQDKALDILIDLHRISEIPSVRSQALQQIESIMLTMEARKAINFLIGIIEESDNEDWNFDYLRILAKVYEKAHLYREASEIYRILIEYDEKRDETELYYLLAVNEMYLKNYRGALQYLDLILNSEDLSYESDALILSSLAYYSLDQHYRALLILSQLYYDYPGIPKRFEVVRNLIELLIEMELYFFAGYYVDNFYHQASPAEKFVLENYKSIISQNRGEEINGFPEIIEMRRLLELTIKGLESYED